MFFLGIFLTDVANLHERSWEGSSALPVSVSFLTSSSCKLQEATVRISRMRDRTAFTDYPLEQ